MGYWQEIRGDMDVKRQILAVACIACLMATFELIFFVTIVVPTVRSGMKSLLICKHPLCVCVRVRTAGVCVPGLVSLPPVMNRGTRAALGVVQEREQELIDRNNSSAKVNGIAIAIVPLLLVVFLLVRHPELRREGLKHVVLDVVMVFGCLAAFQVLFFFMSRQFQFTSTPEMMSNVVREYNATCDDAAAHAKPPQPLSVSEKVALTEAAIQLTQAFTGTASIPMSMTSLSNPAQVDWTQATTEMAKALQAWRLFKGPTPTKKNCHGCKRRPPPLPPVHRTPTCLRHGQPWHRPLPMVSFRGWRHVNPYFLLCAGVIQNMSHVSILYHTQGSCIEFPTQTNEELCPWIDPPPPTLDTRPRASPPRASPPRPLLCVSMPFAQAMFWGGGGRDIVGEAPGVADRQPHEVDRVLWTSPSPSGTWM